MRVKFSMVVPVYNAEEFLPTCLDSLLKQDYPNFEIILVDNNSSDGSYSLCKRYAKKHPKIISAVRCKIPGAAAAKNYGIKRSSGEYIWCIDSDDWIEPNSLSLINDVAQNNPDIITIGWSKDTPGKDPETYRLRSSEANQNEMFIMSGFGPWGLVARKEFLLDNDLLYPEGVIHEDMALISSFVLYTDSIKTIEQPLYHYVQRQGSVLHSKWSEKEFDIFTALDLLYKRFESQEAVDTYKDELEYFFIWNLLIDAAQSFAKADNFSDAEIGYRRTRQILRTYFPKWYKNKYMLQRGAAVCARRYLSYFGIVKGRSLRRKTSS